ncbi:hypothetical protein Rhopal_006680-T1 [Rhodotorula paludigena]|uniref:Lysophospholipase n=1 Tax=Rhodotorula paludigena TaxID=86838 RepID=A0AAV5GYN6_9BASI|nr:hypothetical protein Rhopal_006680-T1 [Rhodotorula paludigena]
MNRMIGTRTYQRRLVPRRWASSSSRSLSITRPAHSLVASSVLLAGAGLGVGIGLEGKRLGRETLAATRSLWSRSLRCDDQPAHSRQARAQEDAAAAAAAAKEDEGFLDKLRAIGIPNLPSPPSLSLPSVSLPDFSLSLPTIPIPDVSGALSSWRDSITSVTSTFSKLQDELSLGPDSTYGRIVAEGKDPAIHPELQWDATVRLGTDLPLSERAFLRNRRAHMRAAFARLIDVPLEDVDERDLPVVAIAASGGGYRAMLNTTASLEAAKETGLWDVTTFISSVSGSCWALNTLFSIGGGDISWTLRHLRSRVKEPFLRPETLVDLLDVDNGASRAILTAPILKDASTGGEISLVDAYGVFVSTRLYVPSPDLPPPPRPLSLRALKTSAQRDLTDDGKAPLPIYTTVRHDIPPPEELEAIERQGGEKAKERMTKAEYTWFETTPYEVGSDKLGAWIPTWALGRVFEDGRSAERVPELGIPVLSGIYASAFSASLFSYFLEVRPLLASLPLFSRIDDFVKSNAFKLDMIHPLPPAELPNFLYRLPSSSLSSPSSLPSSLTSARTLGFADAGINLNLPYLPLLRRQCDVVIALDASADSQDLWFQRAAEYSRQYEVEGRPGRWPRVDVEALFPRPADEGGEAEGAARKVDQAKKQERIAGPLRQRKGVDERNPEPVPLGSAPESAQHAAGEMDKSMPTSQASEPPLSRCSIWIGSTRAEDASSCRNDHPTVEQVASRDGIALAYVPLLPDAKFPNPLEVFSTWQFDYKEEETDKLIRLAKDNFKAGEEQLKTVLKGVWLRKRAQRLADEQQSGAAEA